MRKKITSIIIIVSLISCGQNPESILSKYESTFKTEFLHHSVLIRANTFAVEIYKEPKVNTYYFEKDNDEFKFMNDSIEFDIREIAKYSDISISEKDQYITRLQKTISQLYEKMKKAKVSSFTSEFYKFGIDMEINIKEQKLLYVTDTGKVANSEWKKFLHHSKEIKEGWYVYKIPE